MFGAQMSEDLEERMGGDAGGAVDELVVVFVVDACEELRHQDGVGGGVDVPFVSGLRVVGGDSGNLSCGGVVEIGWSAGIGGGNEGLASCDGVGDLAQYEEGVAEKAVATVGWDRSCVGVELHGEYLERCVVQNGWDGEYGIPHGVEGG